MPEIGVNKVILIGRTRADAELRYTSNGKAVANFSLAINESFKNGDGEQKEHVEWVGNYPLTTSRTSAIL